LRQFGARAIPSLAYPHKPGMAQWLNDWCTDFAQRVPEAVHCATFFPEDGVGDYVRAAVEGGARLFKMHVQVGVFRPDDALLEPAWGVLEDAQVPVVPHAGSAPKPGKFTGPGPVRALLRRHPRLVLVIAHLGMSSPVSTLRHWWLSEALLGCLSGDVQCVADGGPGVSFGACSSGCGGECYLGLVQFDVGLGEPGHDVDGASW